MHNTCEMVTLEVDIDMLIFILIQKRFMCLETKTEMIQVLSSIVSVLVLLSIIVLFSKYGHFTVRSRV